MFDLKTGSCNLFYRAIAENCCYSLEKTQSRYCHVSRECFPLKKNSACISPNRAVHPADVPPGRKSLPRYMNAASVRSFARSIFNESLRNIELHLLIHFLFFTSPFTIVHFYSIQFFQFLSINTRSCIDFSNP